MSPTNRLAMVVMIGVILGGILVNVANKTEYSAPTEVVEKEVDALEQAITHAQEAQQAEIEATAQQAYEEAKTHEMKKIELEVISEFNKKLDARQIELEKQTNVY